MGIDETEALRRFSPESITRLPEELENIPFDELDKDELRWIADFINFKLSQKRRVLQRGGRGSIHPDRRKAAGKRTKKKLSPPDVEPDTINARDVIKSKDFMSRKLINRRQKESD